MNISRPWTREEDEFLLAHYENLPTMEVSRALNRWHGNVTARAKKFGLISIKQAARAAIKHDYFQEVCTPLQAYILGLLASDGWVTRNEIAIKLSAKDEQLVRLVRNQLAPLHRVVPVKPNMFSFRVSSQQMRNDLARFNIVPCKSLILEYPSLLSSELDNSFILGCFDGDGCLSKRGNGHRWSLVSGSEQFLRDVQSRTVAATGVMLGGPIPQRADSKARVLYCQAARDVLAVDTWLHADVPGLARKRLGGECQRPRER